MYGTTARRNRTDGAPSEGLAEDREEEEEDDDDDEKEAACKPAILEGILAVLDCRSPVLLLVRSVPGGTHASSFVDFFDDAFQSVRFGTTLLAVRPSAGATACYVRARLTRCGSD